MQYICTYICPRDAEKIHSTTCMLFYFIVKGKSLFQIIFAIKIIVKSCRYQTSTQTNIVVVEKNGWENVDPPKIKILIRDSPIQQEINCRVNTTMITITLLQVICWNFSSSTNLLISIPWNSKFKNFLSQTHGFEEDIAFEGVIKIQVLSVRLEWLETRAEISSLQVQCVCMSNNLAKIFGDDKSSRRTEKLQLVTLITGSRKLLAVL